MEPTRFVNISPCTACPRGCAGCSGKARLGGLEKDERHLRLTPTARKTISKLVRGAVVEVAGETGDPHYYSHGKDPNSNLEGLHKLLVKAGAKEITYLMNGDLFRNKEKAMEEVSRFKRIIGDRPVRMQYMISVGFPKTGVKNWRKITAGHPKVKEQNKILDNLHEVATRLGVDYQVTLHGHFEKSETASKEFKKYKETFHLQVPSEQSAFKKFSYAKWLTPKEIGVRYQGNPAIMLGAEPINILHNGLIYRDSDGFFKRPIGSVYRGGMFGVEEACRK
ncbi:MAG: hypothetical protein WCX64_01820 [Candidatus Micrarchaeia archaeon]